MLIRSDSLALRALLFIASPVAWLPHIVPLWVEHARVGDDYDSWVRVTLRKR